VNLTVREYFDKRRAPEQTSATQQADGAPRLKLLKALRTSAWTLPASADRPVAQLLKVDQRTVGGWRLGRHQPQPKNRRKLALVDQLVRATRI
jgi:hypothetical protein